MKHAFSHGWGWAAVAGGAVMMACGNGISTHIQTAEGITGGTEVASSAYPSVVAIYLRDDSQICTGTIIAPDVVLTAGHCLAKYESNNIEIRTGISNFAEDDGVTYLVEDWVVHPEFLETGSKIRHDVALIYLTAPVVGITPTPINRAVNAAAPGGQGTIIGYGRPDVGGTSGILRAATNRPIATCDRLEEIIFEATDGFVIDYEEEQFVCWERLDGIGKCRGDSGGPTFMTVGGQQVVVGVSSASDTTCEYYSLDAEVAYELAFIDDELTARQCGEDGVCNQQCVASGLAADADCQDEPGCPDQDGACDPPEFDDTDGGAGCAASQGQAAGAMWLVLALGALALRRRLRRLA